MRLSSCMEITQGDKMTPFLSAGLQHHVKNRLAIPQPVSYWPQDAETWVAFLLVIAQTSNIGLTFPPSISWQRTLYTMLNCKLLVWLWFLWQLGIGPGGKREPTNQPSEEWVWLRFMFPLTYCNQLSVFFLNRKRLTQYQHLLISFLKYKWLIFQW